MLKKYKLGVIILTLIISCSACVQEAGVTPTAETVLIPTEAESHPVPAEAAEPAEASEVLSFMRDGKLQDTPANIFSNGAYSILIPKEGWSQSGDGNTLTLSEENLALIEIKNLGSISFQEAQQRVNEPDYTLQEDAKGGFSGTDLKEENYQQISFYPAEEGIYVVRYVFPMAQWEGIGYEVMAICDSFSLVHPASISPEGQPLFPAPEETQSSVPSQEPQNTVGIQDDDFVRIKDYIPSVKEMLYYATTDNFTGQRIYDFSEAYLRYGTVKKLAAASEEFRQQGFGLIIWDGFRPVSAQNKLWEVCPDTNYVSCPKGYRAHCRGSAVDVTLYDLKTGAPVSMPSGFDDFTSAGDRDFSDCSKEEADNAQLLRKVMESNGFHIIQSEWWHFSDAEEYPIEENFYPSISSTEDTLPECITEFHGTITVNEESKTLDLYYYEGSEQNYFYELVVAGKSKTIPLRNDFIPSTVMHGFEIKDVNQDGINDIIVELGIYGKMKPADCFIGTAELDYIRIAGFSELYDPIWMPASCTIMDSGRGDAGEYWMNRYEVSEAELVLIESLSWIYTNGSSPKYTAKKVINGETVIVHDSVSESEIDMEHWHQ